MAFHWFPTKTRDIVGFNTTPPSSPSRRWNDPQNYAPAAVATRSPGGAQFSPARKAAYNPSRQHGYTELPSGIGWSEIGGDLSRCEPNLSLLTFILSNSVLLFFSSSSFFFFSSYSQSCPTLSSLACRSSSFFLYTSGAHITSLVHISHGPCTHISCAGGSLNLPNYATVLEHKASGCLVVRCPLPPDALAGAKTI